MSHLSKTLSFIFECCTDKLARHQKDFLYLLTGKNQLSFRSGSSQDTNFMVIWRGGNLGQITQGLRKYDKLQRQCTSSQKRQGLCSASSVQCIIHVCSDRTNLLKDKCIIKRKSFVSMQHTVMPNSSDSDSSQKKCFLTLESTNRFIPWVKDRLCSQDNLLRPTSI